MLKDLRQRSARADARQGVDGGGHPVPGSGIGANTAIFSG